MDLPSVGGLRLSTLIEHLKKLHDQFGDGHVLVAQPATNGYAPQLKPAICVDLRVGMEGAAPAVVIRVDIAPLG